MSPYPAITGNAVLRALAPADAVAAGHKAVAVEQAALDEQELRELEHAEYYDGPALIRRSVELARGTDSGCASMIIGGPPGWTSSGVMAYGIDAVAGLRTGAANRY